jgi:hypothetical protein
MNRTTVYPGAIPLDTDLLSAQQNTMIAFGFLAQMMGGVGTLVDGLACIPTSPASMQIKVGPGAILVQTTLEATAWGSLPADTTDNLVKIGSNTGTTLLTLAAPGSAGQSINYLIEAAYLEADGVPVTLPYYNAAVPSVPFTGPANTGTAQNTVRAQTVQLQARQRTLGRRRRRQSIADGSACTS